MEMFYITRYENNPDRKTEYYVGGGVWETKSFDRIRVRLYENERMAKAVIKNLTECDWHSVEIRT